MISKDQIRTKKRQVIKNLFKGVDKIIIIKVILEIVISIKKGSLQNVSSLFR